MPQLLLTNIKGLIQVENQPKNRVAGAEMQNLPMLEGAFLLLQEGKILDFGPMAELQLSNLPEGVQQHDCSGRFVFPSFVDPHTHLVFAGSREGEFVDRIKGLSYEEIARRGGGILNSADRLQQTSEDELFESALERLHEVIAMGTGAIEIKSGYGLTVEDELKMLRVVRRLREVSPIPIKATLLGAHAIPRNFLNNREGFIDLVVNELIPRVAEEGLAEYCDVFCDRGFFTPEETDRILKQGLKFGLIPKLHAHQLAPSGGIKVGVENGAISVDHLEHVGPEETELLLNSATMPTLLPGAAFFLGLPYQPAREMINAGLPIALASDYNPGSSPSGNMAFLLTLACVKLRMTPEEAINACTINAAAAIGLQQSHGSICRGKAANLFITKPMASYAQMPYFFGHGAQLIDKVILNGNFWQKPEEAKKQLESIH